MSIDTAEALAAAGYTHRPAPSGLYRREILDAAGAVVFTGELDATGVVVAVVVGGVTIVVVSFAAGLFERLARFAPYAAGETFTLADASVRHASACRERGCALVIGATGQSAAQRAELEEIARGVPIVLSPNMSLGVNVLFRLAELAARAQVRRLHLFHHHTALPALRREAGGRRHRLRGCTDGRAGRNRGGVRGRRCCPGAGGLVVEQRRQQEQRSPRGCASSLQSQQQLQQCRAELESATASGAQAAAAAEATGAVSAKLRQELAQLQLQLAQQGLQFIGVPLTPDFALCEACTEDLRQPGNRRHRYAFVNCTQCGPRYTIIEALPHLVPNEDEACSKALERAYRKRGINFSLGVRFASATQDDNGVHVTLEDSTTLDAELLLVAVGRGPNATGMGFEEQGVAMDRGWVLVDDRLRNRIGVWLKAGNHFLREFLLDEFFNDGDDACIIHGNTLIHFSLFDRGQQ